MLNPTSNLRDLSTSLTNRCAVFIVRRILRKIPGEKKKQLRLVQALLVAEFGKVCTQFEEKPAVAKDTRYWLHRLQSSSRSVHNSRKTSYTVVRLAKAHLQVSRAVIQYTILGI